jgi:hypothetical protein
MIVNNLLLIKRSVPDNAECQAACRPRMDYVVSGSNVASLIDVASFTEENTASAS